MRRFSFLDECLSLLGDEFPIVDIIAGCVAVWFIIGIVRYFMKNEE